MIEKLWYGKNRLFWLLIPFSLLYGLIAFVRRFLYKIGIFKSWRSPVPIIIIGNLRSEERRVGKEWRTWGGGV